MNNTKKISLINYILITILGFGLGGAFFGWRFYQVPSSELFVDPLSYLIEVIIWAILGGISLSILSKNIKQIFRTSLLGVIGWLIGGGMGYIVFYFPFLFGVFSGVFWQLLCAVVITGAFIGGFYALALRIRIWPMVLLGVGGFTFGTVIGIVIENILRKSSPLAGSIFMFLITGIILGVFLGLGVYRGLSRDISTEKPTSTS